MPFFIDLESVKTAIIQARTFLTQTISDLEGLLSQSPLSTHCISIADDDPGLFDFAQRGLKGRNAISSLRNWQSLESNGSFSPHSDYEIALDTQTLNLTPLRIGITGLDAALATVESAVEGEGGALRLDAPKVATAKRYITSGASALEFLVTANGTKIPTFHSKGVFYRSGVLFHRVSQGDLGVHFNSSGDRACVSWTPVNVNTESLNSSLSGLKSAITFLDGGRPGAAATPATGVSIDQSGTIALLASLEQLYGKVNNENFIQITRLEETVQLIKSLSLNFHLYRSAEAKVMRKDSKEAVRVLGTPEVDFVYEILETNEDGEIVGTGEYTLFANNISDFLARFLGEYWIPTARQTVETRELVVLMHQRMDVLFQNLREVIFALGGRTVTDEEWEQIRQQREG